MKTQYGLISCDSHAQLHKDTWTSRMSKAKFGDRIPQLREKTDKEHMIRATDKPVERCFEDIPENERRQVLVDNAARHYKLNS